MNRRSNWEDFKNILEQNHITKLYHFTDRDNLENIIINTLPRDGKRKKPSQSRHIFTRL